MCLIPRSLLVLVRYLFLGDTLQHWRWCFLGAPGGERLAGAQNGRCNSGTAVSRFAKRNTACFLFPLCGYHFSTRRQRRILRRALQMTTSSAKTNCNPKTFSEDFHEDKFPPKTSPSQKTNSTRGIESLKRSRP